MFMVVAGVVSSSRSSSKSLGWVPHLTLYTPDLNRQASHPSPFPEKVPQRKVIPPCHKKQETKRSTSECRMPSVRPSAQCTHLVITYGYVTDLRYCTSGT